MCLVIQNIKANYFGKKLLKYIFMKLDFINILRHIVLNRYEIYHSPNDCQMNNKSHDFYLHELLILRE